MTDTSADETTAAIPGGYQLTRIHRTGPYPIRLHLYRVTDRHLSCATAQVPAPTWTDPPSRRQGATTRAELLLVADTLLHRAAAVLAGSLSAAAPAPSL